VKKLWGSLVSSAAVGYRRAGRLPTCPQVTNLPHNSTPKKAAAFLALALVFVLANLDAYRGYFQGDDLDTLSWTRYTPLATYLEALVSPRYFPSHFRPAGHITYWILHHTVGFSFPWLLAFLQLLHILNLWLLWRVMRNLGLPDKTAALGLIFFSFHMAAIDAYWKPQFIFDILCATFSLASLLCYVRKRWVASFVCFWLAYKSKELAVMLPVVLAAYEFWLGERRWKRLIPFLAVALSFGLQGIIVNHRERAHTMYALHFSLKVLWRTASFYASKLFLVRYLGFAVLALPFFVRDRRAWFGLAILVLFLIPLIPLPGRLAEVYLYLPLAGAAIIVASLATGPRAFWPAVIFLALWMPWNYLHSRSGRRNELAMADENRAYVAGVRDYFRQAGALSPRVFLFDGYPRALGPWGVRGALTYFAPEPVTRYDVAGADFHQALPDAPLFQWDDTTGRLVIRQLNPRLSSIDMRQAESIWQLDDGWFGRENGARWTAPRATACLYRLPESRQFEVTVQVTPQLIKDIQRTRLAVSLDGRPLGDREFSVQGRQTVTWDLPPGAPGPVEIEFRSEPRYRPSNGDPRTLGIAIQGFGFR
jgi:hypothetical protein